MNLNLCPDCEEGKHGACVGQAWDKVLDEPTPCNCPNESHV